MLTAKERTLLEALEPQAEKRQVEIVTVEVVGAKKSPTIRVYIDMANGVSFDELSAAQSWINGIVDELDPFPGAYTLEVSSPGIDRPLRTREHFERFSGEEAVLTTVAPLENRSKFTGVLQGIDADDVLIDVEGTLVSIAFDNLKRARLKGTVQFGS